MIKVLLVDDQKILLEGLAKILAPLPDIEVIGTCTLSELAEEACLRLRPDLVLMDFCMEGRTSGIQIYERLKATFPSLRIILMTGMQEIAFLDWAKEAGANSFIYKESSGEAFASCIRATMEGAQIYPDICGTPSFGCPADEPRARDPAAHLPQHELRGNRRGSRHQEAHRELSHQQYARQDRPRERHRPCGGSNGKGLYEHPQLRNHGSFQHHRLGASFCPFLSAQ